MSSQLTITGIDNVCRKKLAPACARVMATYVIATNFQSSFPIFSSVILAKTGIQSIWY